jgi:hypothetical protein
MLPGDVLLEIFAFYVEEEEINVQLLLDRRVVAH